MSKISFALLAFSLALNLQAQDKKASAPGQTADEKSAAEFKFEIEEYNFGTLKQGEMAKYDFVFTNVGKEPLIITEAHASCGCTVPDWPKEPVRKGEKGIVKVTFNSTGKQGMQDKTVTITSNARGGQKVLRMKGNVEGPAPAPTSVPVQAVPVPDKK